MPDPTHLPHLLRLLEDPSARVREAVARELAEYGPRLKTELLRLRPGPTEDQLRDVQDVLEHFHRDWLALHWSSWKRHADPRDGIEAAQDLLARFQYGTAYPIRLPALLDQLAEEYLQRYPQADPFRLAHFLFQALPLRGEGRRNGNPRLANLLYCLLERQGAAISLCCVYMLVGKRLHLDIDGLPVSGHFLARVRHQGTVFAVDCFDGGRFLSRVELASMRRNVADAIRRSLDRPASASGFMDEVLCHLHRAYLRCEQEENALLMLDLMAAPFSSLPAGPFDSL